ncbi:glutamyl-tRNA reductase [bacterium]|nr:glutamyl-tRNA reductase [bacterium]
MRSIAPGTKHGTNCGTIFCVGANHRSADIALREKFHAVSGRIVERLPAIQQQFGFAELATLSTCNRFEIFGVTSACHDFNGTLHEAFVAFDMLDNDAAQMARHAAYALTGRDAVRHLFSVAASLDSLVVGETQITGQFKQALELAEQAKTLGPVLKRLGQEALAASKKVRTRTAIGRGRVSIGHAAVDLVRRIFNDPATKNFVIIGAGEMAEVAARCVRQHQPASVLIINRTLDRARALADRLNTGAAASTDQLEASLRTADVVISATGAPGQIVMKDMLAPLIRARKGRPLLMVDIALPRDIDPRCGALDDVFLFDIDDLKQVIDSNRQDRMRAAGEAAAIIDESVAAWERWFSHMTVAPALRQFNVHVDRMFRREAGKTFSRAALSTLTEDQAAHIWQLLDVLAARLTADAGRGLRDLVDEGKGHEAAAILTKLFHAGDNEPAFVDSSSREESPEHDLQNTPDIHNPH